MQLNRLHFNGHNGDWIEQEYLQIKSGIDAEKAVTAPGWAPLFRVKEWRWRLFIATLVQVFTQMTG
jgi:hypothetical protein